MTCSMRILLDMDGVLCDFVKGCCELFNVPYEPEQHHHHDSICETLGVKPRDFWAALRTEFWESLEPYPWVDDLFAEIRYWDICILSSPPSTNLEEAVIGKTRWLKAHFPGFIENRKFLIGPAKSFCASESSMLIDDHQKNVFEFVEAGGYACLFPQPWNSNRGADRITTVRESLDGWLAKRSC